MWELNYKESCALKNWCFWTVVWRSLLRVPWIARRSNPSILKHISPEYSLDSPCSPEGKTPILCPPDVKNRLIGKDPDVGKDWRWEENDRGFDRGWDGWMASPTQWTWVWVNSRSWQWTGGLARCSPWGCRESDTTEDWTELNWDGMMAVWPGDWKQRWSGRAVYQKLWAEALSFTTFSQSL